MITRRQALLGGVAALVAARAPSLPVVSDPRFYPEYTSEIWNFAAHDEPASGVLRSMLSSVAAHFRVPVSRLVAAVPPSAAYSERPPLPVREVHLGLPADPD